MKVLKQTTDWVKLHDLKAILQLRPEKWRISTEWPRVTYQSVYQNSLCLVATIRTINDWIPNEGHLAGVKITNKTSSFEYFGEMFLLLIISRGDGMKKSLKL